MSFQNTGAIKKTIKNERTNTITYNITSTKSFSSTSVTKSFEKSFNKIENERSTTARATSIATLNDSSTTIKRPDFKSSYSLPQFSSSSSSSPYTNDKQFRKTFEDSSSGKQYKIPTTTGSSNPFVKEFNNKSEQNLSSSNKYEYRSPYSGNTIKITQPSLQEKLPIFLKTQTNKTIPKTNENKPGYRSYDKKLFEKNSNQPFYKHQTTTKNPLEQSFEKNSNQPFYKPRTTTKNPLEQPGICYIFNHENFDSSKKDYRVGSREDVILLQKTFKLFKVNVTVFTDLTVSKIQTEINKIEKKDFSKYSCIIIVILSHGNRQETIKAKDGVYSVDDNVLFPLLRNRTLVLKPKILIIQACKGNMFATDSGQNMTNAIGKPMEIIKCYSTFEGYVAFRTEEGSIFIRSFCDLLAKYGKSKNIKEIMEMVIEVVKNQTNGVQIPSFLTTMTKPYVFGDYI